MKLKLVIASMSILGLISSPVLAGHVKHKMRHHKKMAKHHMAAYHKYKMMSEHVPVQPAQMATMPLTMAPVKMTLVEMTQNVGRAMPMPGWFNHISVGGGMNMDFRAIGNRTPRFEGENYQRFALNDVYLNMKVPVNDWTKLIASLSYSNPTNNTGGAAQYSGVYDPRKLTVTQAFVHFGNFDAYPVFVQIGKQFQDFSRYEIHPITRSMTQVLSEVLATSAKIGFILPVGLHGSASLFETPIKTTGSSRNQLNGVAALGFDRNNELLGYDIGVGYIDNLVAAGDVVNAIANSTTNGGSGSAASLTVPGTPFATTTANLSTATFSRRVHGVALYGDVNSGPFTIAARYTGATQRFSGLDISKNATVTGTTATGAKPWALGLQGGYNFNAWDKNQNVYLGYQTSREAANLFLPKSRWQVGYNVDMWEHTNLGAEFNRDNDYPVTQGGTGNGYNSVSLRAAVKIG